MSDLPIERESLALQIPISTTRELEEREELDLRQILLLLRRNVWLLLASVCVGAGVAVYMTSKSTPIYQAWSTVRIQDKTPNLPGFFRVSASGNSEVSTEAEVLRSRTLAEAAVIELKLQIRLLAPKGVVRDELIRNITVDPAAPPGLYEMQRLADGKFAVLRGEKRTQIATIRVGEELQLEGAAFRLDSAALDHESIQVLVQPAKDVAMRLVGSVDVEPAGRGVDILRLEYQDTDRDLAWRVPNALIERFIASREENLKEEARSTVTFLRRQLDTLAGQLIGAENEVKRYRERHMVVSPEAEASSQVTRLIGMEAERSTLEGERTALAQLLTEVDARAAQKGADDPSPYRQLLAFPTLLRSQAATDLLNTLSNVEQERTTLLARRTPQDPDVQALNGRIGELEGQLRSVVAAYLQGLKNQIATIDAGLNRFGQQLSRLPQREIEVARLERHPKVLAEIYTLLQTRLKEAEISEAAKDPSVRVVDPAIPPRWPISPRPVLNLLAGMVGGLLLGLTLMTAKELRDRAVRTRSDVHVATGLPVLGLIPRIPLRGRKLALITEKKVQRVVAGPATEAALPPRTYTPPPNLRRTYTFLAATDDAEEASPESTSEVTPPEPLGPPAKMLQLAVSELGLPVAEAYSLLETNIAFSRLDGAIKVVALTSPLPGDGKTTTGINMAISLARRGLSVLLIDADLRRGMVHTAFEAPRAPGLSEVLRGTISFERARGWVNVDGQTLHFLASGGLVPNPTGTVSSGEMRDLIARIRDDYDLILVDSPPTNIVTDASLLASMADGVILVARAGVTESGALSVAMDQLRHVRAPVLGVILNDIDFKRDSAYDRAYRYYNYSQYMSSARD